MAFIGNTPAESYVVTVKDSFNGTGSQTDFTLSQPSTTNDVRVVVENVVQEPTTAYTVTGTTLAFTSAPPSGTGNIYVIHLGPAVATATPPETFGVGSIYGASDPDTAITFEGSGVTTFDQNGSEAARFDASGNLLVGKTSANVATTGAEVRPTGLINGTSDSASAAYFNRKTTDGTIIDLRRDNSAYGSIGINSAQVYVAGTGAGLKYGTGNLRPTNGSGATTDNAVALGSSSFRFTDLYLSGGVYLGGTGSANYLDDYENGTWTATVNTAGYTISSQDLDYTKVGEIVHIYGKIRFSAIGSSTSQISLSGLPFSRESTTYGIPGIVREASSFGYIYVLQIDASGNWEMNSYDGVSSGSDRIFYANKDYFLSAHYKA